MLANFIKDPKSIYEIVEFLLEFLMPLKFNVKRCHEGI